MTRFVECIPNFSEARRPEIVDQIVAAITFVEGVHACADYATQNISLL